MSAVAKPKVLLIGWDGADWQVAAPLMAAGRMPFLRKLVECGMQGNLETIEPVLSPMLWTTISTGKRAFDHGVCGFTDVSPEGRVRPVSAASRKCRSIWEILAEQGAKCHAISWFATHGEQIPGGSVVSNLYQSPTAPPGRPWPPAPRGTIWPDDHLDILNELRVSPEEIDEDTVRLFVPEAARVDQEQDRRLGHLRVHLAEAFSVQAAATWTLEHREWDFAAVYFRAIDELCHHFMPLHPPRLDGVPEELFHLYKDVVNSTYQLHDLMLGRLIALAGPDAHVLLCSDHGFYSDHQRPKFVPKVPAGITVWHRRHGIFAAAGPQLAVKGSVFGASLLDVTPTILQLYGLPVGADMEGKVLVTAFREPPALRTVPTWETEQRSTPANTLLSDEESGALLESFAALGYLDRQNGPADENIRSTRRENQWNLARALMDGHRPERALPILEDICDESPERQDFLRMLARCQAVLGLHDEARATMHGVLETAGNAPGRRLFAARLALDEGRASEAAAILDELTPASTADAVFWRLLAETSIKLRRWGAGETASRAAIALKPDDAAAWLDLAICLMRQQNLEAAGEAALKSTDLCFSNPHGHLVLGVTQMQTGHPGRAETALKTAIRYAPEFARAHQWLSLLYRRQNRRDEAIVHRLAGEHSVRLRDERDARVMDARAAAAVRLRPRPLRRASGAPDGNSSGPPVAPGSFVIVSGMPRSGTSLMMQMLALGGLPPMTDNHRKSDVHNEGGYFEWEEIRSLPANPRILEKANGRAVKIISALLPSLPRLHTYRIIFMERPLVEIARSQHLMRFGCEGDPAELEATVVPVLQKHLDATFDLLRAAANVSLLVVNYPQLVRDPAPWARRIATFIGAELLPRASVMPEAVQKRHYRQREGAATESRQ